MGETRFANARRHGRLLLGLGVCALGGTAVLGSSCEHTKPGPGSGDQTDVSDDPTDSDDPLDDIDAGGGPSKTCLENYPKDVVVTEPPDSAQEVCGDVEYCDPWSPGYFLSDADKSTVASLVSGMSLSEKAEQARGTSPGGGSNYSDIFRTPDSPNKGIKGFDFRDGPNGVNLAAQLPAGKKGYSTAFPVPMARAATFDLDLEKKIGQAMGDETLGSGNNLLLAPTINVLRHPAWGRAQETYGEDPYLQGRFGTAYVAGVQEYVPACVKHFAANNIENGRSSSNSQMDEQTLREMYTRHFEMVIRDGGVACVMASYNLVNGKKATQSKHLLNEILRDDFDFKGFVMSDWWAMPPGTAGTGTDALAANANEAINAGLDMELPWAYNYQQLEAITGPGKPVEDATVTRAATRILEQKYRFKVAKMGERMGLKQPVTSLDGTGSIAGNDSHIALAQEAARKSITLLKNQNSTLPIVRGGAIKKIAVIGAHVQYHVVNTDLADGTIKFATDPRLGDLGSGRVFPDPTKSSGPFAGIKEAAGSGIEVSFGNAASAADNVDFVVVVAGLTPEDEGEEYTGAGDRPNFSLDGKKGGKLQNDLIAAVAAKGKPMVVVLVGGSVIDMPWLSSVPAVVMAYYPGMDGGRALGKLLFGDVNFSGKLPFTWAKNWNDLLPFNPGQNAPMDYFLGYRYYDSKNIEPLFPFGFGLSYTKYVYSNIKVPCSTVSKNGVVNVTVDIKNDGSVAGEEVAFLWVSYPAGPRRPVKELKGFHRVALEPGQTKRITFPVRVADLKYFDQGANDWRISSGEHVFKVGPSSATLPLSGSVEVQ